MKKHLLSTHNLDKQPRPPNALLKSKNLERKSIHKNDTNGPTPSKVSRKDPNVCLQH